MSAAEHKKTVPELRFPKFSGAWEQRTIDSLLVRSSQVLQPAPDGQYREIGVRSHGKGVFHKDPVSGASLGDKRVFHVVPNALVLNIVFAWEQAVALTTEQEAGFIASHRFPMFVEREGESYLPFMLELFLTKRGKWLLELASPGGAGRNKTLGQDEFQRLKVSVPSRSEQKLIATFLKAIDRGINLLQKKHNLLSAYRRGVMQQIFSQKIRFKRDDGSSFPNWEEKRLDEIATFSKGKGVSKEATEKAGGTPCIRYAELYTRYGTIIDEPFSSTGEARSELVISQGGEVIVPASGESAIDIGSFAYVARAGIAIGGDLNIIRSRDVDGMFLARYLRYFRWREVARLAQGISVIHLYGAQLSAIKVNIPHPDEQKKISAFLTSLDDKEGAVAKQVALAEAFRKGLVQRMFV